jgi:hypothetical protein
MLPIAFFGITLSIFIWRTLKRAASQLSRLERWWYGEREYKGLEKTKLIVSGGDNFVTEKQIIRKHPPLQGRSLGKFDNYINGENIPFVFVISWIFLLVFSGLFRLEEIYKILSKQWPIYVIGLLLVVIFIMGFLLLRKKN